MADRLDVMAQAPLAWKVFERRFIPLLLGGVIALAISTVSLGICAGPMYLGLQRMALAAVRGKRIEATDVLRGFEDFVPALILFLALAVSIGIGLLLLVLPGLALAVMLFWAPLFMAEGDLEPVSCIRKSWDFTMGQIGPAAMWALLVLLGNAIAGSFFIGLVLALPLTAVLNARGYVSAIASTE